MEERKIFSLKIIIGAVIVAFLLLLYLFLILNGKVFRNRVESTPKAEITILAAGVIPTVDQGLLSITSTPTLNPTENVEGIQIADYVRVEGTAGSGLKIRVTPGKTGEVSFIANESEVYFVIGGSQLVDDITWWQVATPYDENRQGWAAADYLIEVKIN